MKICPVCGQKIEDGETHVCIKNNEMKYLKLLMEKEEEIEKLKAEIERLKNELQSYW